MVFGIGFQNNFGKAGDRVKIVMAHGSGGNATRELINNVFKKYFSNPYLDELSDSACLEKSEYPLALTTDSHVVSPIIYPGGDIGKLAVCGTVNDLWMVGAEPQYLTSGFIMEEGLEMETLERIVRSMSEAAKMANVLIVTGDTKVVEGNGGLYINTAGLGYRKFSQKLGAKSIKAGDSIIISGSLGNHHACILSQRMSIKNSIESDCAPLGSAVSPLLKSNLNIKILRDVTRGGLATVLNEIAESANVSMELIETAIPVDPEVKSFCDILGLDPFYMANEGKFMCIVDNNDKEEALAIIKSTKIGENARIIGTVDNMHCEPIVAVKTRLGGRRIIDVLYGEGLPRIC